MEQPKNTEPQTIFQIPETNMWALSQKIETLNRKAKRLKCPPVVTKVLAVEKRKVRVCLGYATLDSAPDVAFETVTRTYFTVEVLGVSPVLPGWKFLGTLQHENAGNIIRSVPGVEIPESYRQGRQKCDHCKKIRSRKDTYIVQNEAGEVLQIGHNCIRDYLGHISPQQLALFATFLKEMESCGEEGFGGGGGGERSIHPSSFMEQAAQLILENGFVSKAAAQSYAEKSEGKGHLTTTSSKTWEYLFPGKDLKKEMMNDPEKFAITEAAVRLASETLEWVKNLKVNSNYEHNLKITLSKDYLTFRDAGIAASAIAAYERFIGKEFERVKKARYGENSKHFGQIGKREVFEFTVLGTKVFESDFSESLTLIRMQDQQGNLAVWFTSSRHDDIEIGKTYRVKATVKRHDQYKGIAQTVVNRCKIESELTQVNPT